MRRRYYLFLAAVLIALTGCNSGSVRSGDRVLVAKPFYELGLARPQRFEVVVFKNPEEPIRRGVPRNFIKRLLGLSGEILAIFFGQLFFWDPNETGDPPPFDDVNNPDINLLDLWKLQNTHINDPKNRDAFEAGKFTIVRKPPDIMLAMRRIVYDNDFPARDLIGPRWQRWVNADGGAWTGSDERNFRVTAGDAKESWLRYRHRLRIAPEQNLLISDFMDYNTGSEVPQPNWVGDLMLECELRVEKAEGEFVMELSRGIYRYQARWQLADGKCRLLRLDTTKGSGKEWEPLAIKDTSVKGPGTYQLRFANFDSRLTVWVGSQLPFGHGFDYDPPEMPTKEELKLIKDQALAGKEVEERLRRRRGPHANDFEPASIGSAGASVQVHHLRLWRDSYYTLVAGPGSSDGNVASEIELSDPAVWDQKLRKLEYKTMYVQPGHFLCLGDNSPSSSDSRHWGLVPQRLLLGRALMVYFPFDRAGPIR